MYRWVEHTAEIELEIEDESPRAVFTEALVALGDLLTEERGREAVTHDLSISAPDLPALLVEWMNELVYLAESDGFIPERVESLHLAGNALEAVVAGQRGEPRPLVKAVTYHGLDLSKSDAGWTARLVLDV